MSKNTHFSDNQFSDSRIKQVTNKQIGLLFKQLKRSWSFSNLVSFCRIRLFNDLHLMRFLENPEKDWLRNQQNLEQQNLFNRQGLLF